MKISKIIWLVSILGSTTSAFADEPTPEQPKPETPPPTDVTPTEPTPTPLTPTPTEPKAADKPAANPLTINMFADGQYVLSTRKNNPVDAMGAPIPQPGHRAWERNNGFALSFLGIDAVYDNEKFAITTSLRFGSSVVPFYAASTASPDIDGVANAFQAYGTWKACPKLTLDIGRFSTIYGAEVAESWKNLNYTRGALYYAFQPFWHTGVRAAYQATDELKLTGMIVNGANNSLDGGKERPSIGVQGAYTKGSGSVLIGYLGSADPDNDFFDHFVDVVATLNIDKLSLVFNADFFTNSVNDDTSTFFGLSAGAGYTVSDKFRLAGRGEVLVDDTADTKVYTGTVTLDYRPLANGNLVLRLDNRFEASDQEIFIDRSAEATKSFFQTVVGVVVTSN